ncbi:phosphatidic acid phosphatase [Arthrobacter roseus]|uniref:phosphatidic acid phosphatase n=1 Tax=Arthrobacter roseus TaxID=136274 RepID=UPI001962AAD4|nr:phosphatidic acid phosphatase [Arthrobacter roseus]MBM7849443.1 membrane-associated phospholipid phosphatase [Arthrobacter roseus]
MERTSATRRSTLYRTAAFVTELFAPAVLVTVMLLLAGIHADGLTGLLPAFVAIVFVTALPFAGIFLLTRRGTVTDHHVGERRQRAPILLGTLGSIAVGILVLRLMDAPPHLMLMIASTVLGLVLVLIVNLFWKLSVHAAVSVVFAIAAVVLSGPWGLVAVVVPLAVGWSRVVLGAHTRAQVLCGFAAGLLVGFAYVAGYQSL